MSLRDKESVIVSADIPVHGSRDFTQVPIENLRGKIKRFHRQKGLETRVSVNNRYNSAVSVIFQ